MSRMIYVYTGRLADDPRAGSAVRPVQMLKAFRDIGFDVTEVVGYSAERKKAMAEVRRAVRRGERFEFCYMETTTMPMALGDPGHLPLRPFLDLRFLAFLKRNGIPVFLFYRDVYWNFPTHSKKRSYLKRNGALLFYKFELRNLYKLVNCLYLPSERMGKYVPGGHGELKRALPPGCYSDSTIEKAPTLDMRLLYVGGVTPPYYDISDLIECVRENLHFRLVIACRKEEFSVIEKYVNCNSNISVEHRSSKEMRKLYASSDIVMIFNRPNEYLSFAMPVKLFEAVGYGVPILARAGTASADFVAQEGIGWVASGPEEARAILRRLAERPEELDEARARVRQAAARNTWAQRAHKVAGDAEEARNAAGR